MSVLVPRGAWNTGFSLIELLVTLAILGLLATVVVPVAQIERQRTQEHELRRALTEIRKALDDYKQAANEGRITKMAGSSGYPPNLAILVNGVADQRDPKHQKLYFLRRVPRDPMAGASGTDEESWGKRSYDSDADSPREGADVYDVFSHSDKLGLNGIPYSKW